MKPESALPGPMTKYRGCRINESGYALVAVLGALTVMLILITGILPSVAQQVKRERETEMLFRGRQIVDAIARYRILLTRAGTALGQPGQPGAQAPTTAVVGFGWPQSLDQLVEGVNIRGSTNKVRLLRPSALKDPMNPNGSWRSVGFNDPALREFLESYFDSMGQPLSAWPAQFRTQYLGTTIELGGEEQSRRTTRTRSAFGGVFDDGENRPNFLFGVVSESEEPPLRDYYGLERYDQWVFAYIPELQSVRATGDKEIEMLSREIIFPTDPLSQVQYGGRMRVMPMPGRGQGTNNPGPTPQTK